MRSIAFSEQIVLDEALLYVEALPSTCATAFSISLRCFLGQTDYFIRCFLGQTDYFVGKHHYLFFNSDELALTFAFLLFHGVDKVNCNEWKSSCTNAIALHTAFASS